MIKKLFFIVCGAEKPPFHTHIRLHAYIGSVTLESAMVETLKINMALLTPTHTQKNTHSFLDHLKWKFKVVVIFIGSESLSCCCYLWCY